MNEKNPQTYSGLWREAKRMVPARTQGKSFLARIPLKLTTEKKYHSNQDAYCQRVIYLLLNLSLTLFNLNQHFHVFRHMETFNSAGRWLTALRNDLLAIGNKQYRNNIRTCDLARQWKIPSPFWACRNVSLFGLYFQLSLFHGESKNLPGEAFYHYICKKKRKWSSEITAKAGWPHNMNTYKFTIQLNSKANRIEM